MLPWVAVLAGGGGTRLWPMSRRGRPKQFLPLLAGGETLLGATVRRVAPLVPIERVLIITAASQVELVRRTLPSLPPENLVVEPVGRNTAPAIGLGLVEVLRRDPEALVAVLPSDQHIADEPAFLAALQQALAAAARGDVVTIGIRPTRPETGYGYIQRGPVDDDRAGGGASAPAAPVPVAASAPAPVIRFVEKPDRATAEGYLASGQYLWNAGMFFFPAARMRDEIARHVPALGEALGAIAAAPSRLGELYPRVPAISIDYAVMEKLPSQPREVGGGMRVVAGDFGWSDVGSWDALGEVRAPDAAGNACLGEAITVDARGNVVAADAGRVVALVGVEDLVVVASGDAVLVMPRDRAQDVRRVVAALEQGGRDELL